MPTASSEQQILAGCAPPCSYVYLNLDDGWSERNRTADGRLAANKARFPSGIKALADYVHGKGLKFGIYGDAGSMTCAKYPGSLGYEEVDAQTFAEWGAWRGAERRAFVPWLLLLWIAQGLARAVGIADGAWGGEGAVRQPPPRRPCC